MAHSWRAGEIWQLFRAGKDTLQIANELMMREADVYNMLSRAREACHKEGMTPKEQFQQSKLGRS